MMQRNDIQFNSTDYAAFDDAALSSVMLTERERAYLSSALSLMFYREDWQDMSDTQWDALEDKLSTISEKIT
jgi:hypothetical protein